MISGGEGLLSRLCNDQNTEDGLLRLVPEDGKELIEFTRSSEASLGADLKLIKWDTKGGGSQKYARVVPGDIVQTFRNYVDAIITHQVQRKMGRDGLLVLLDEFDVIQKKQGIGSPIKSLTSPTLRFAILLLKETRKDAEELDILNIDQLVPRLVDPTYGPVPKRMSERQGI